MVFDQANYLSKKADGGVIGRSRGMSARDSDRDGHINVAFLGGRREGEVGSEPVFNTRNAFIKLDFRKHSLEILR